jgi:septum formation protein
MKLILASGSPRRAELLERMGLTFTVKPSNTEEILEPGLTPQQEVLSLSLQKGQAVAATCGSDAVVLSADTVVELDGEILGKPKDAQEAATMLRRLSGRSHRVLTGVTVLGPQGTEAHCEETEVYFRPLSEAEIQAYVRTGEPMDKAGAYGIQGYAALFVEKLVGDYYNVMGLPVCRTGLMLRKAGIPVLEETL